MVHCSRAKNPYWNIWLEIKALGKQKQARAKMSKYSDSKFLKAAQEGASKLHIYSALLTGPEYLWQQIQASDPFLHFQQPGFQRQACEWLSIGHRPREPSARSQMAYTKPKSTKHLIIADRGLQTLDSWIIITLQIYFLTWCCHLDWVINGASALSLLRWEEPAVHSGVEYHNINKKWRLRFLSDLIECSRVNKVTPASLTTFCRFATCTES